ncbi:hypothetical protein Tco_1058479 [Tanacetum coccineum]|uniref:Uncharacterized protein n=1 Tax=Tanacetum coccineum TaxID=301880 RepID=A0ABQ5H8D7_9ASTR
MDDEFIATAYPKVHENLKLITGERVINDKPESHSGSMSSLKNLDDTLRVARLEQEMSEVKKTDVLASIRSQVPTAVDNYLGTKLDDALIKKSATKQDQLPSITCSHGNSDSWMKTPGISGVSREKGERPQRNMISVMMNEDDDDDKASAGSTPVGTKGGDDDISMLDEGKSQYSLERERPASPEPDMGPLHQNDFRTEINGAKAYPNMDECHMLLTNKVDLNNSKGDKERKIALSISKLKAARYLDFGLEELVPSLWVESERDYDISAVYGITHWWFRRKEFYINKHSEPSDREAVRSQMRILSVISVKISEKDFKNLHPNDFDDLFLLNIQEKLNHLPKTDKTSLHTTVNMWIRNLVIRNRMGDLELGIESYQTKINLERPNWDAADYYFKEDYTIVPKPRAVVYRDKNDQRKLMRLNELHKFSDGTLTRVMEKLDHMVKDFHLFEYNKGMETRKWSEDDKRRSKDFITAIEKRLQIRRIYRSLESFVGGRIRDIDYRLINRTT